METEHISSSPSSPQHRRSFSPLSRPALGHPQRAASLSSQSHKPAELSPSRLSLSNHILRRNPSYTSNPDTTSSTHPPETSEPVFHHQVLEIDHVQSFRDQVTGNKVVNGYEFLSLIGHGQHGKVKKARNITTNRYVAVKIINRKTKTRLGNHDPDAQEHKIRKEVAIMKKCNHPNVVSLLKVMDDKNSNKIYLVLELMERGELLWHDANNHPTLPMEVIPKILRDVVLGLEYLHFQGIIHRDIKPENLLLGFDNLIKIADFGVSHLLEVDEDGNMTTENDLELSKTAGSPAYFAPELCQTPEEDLPRMPITKAIDVWALGISLYCLFFGKAPFHAGNEYELFNIICNEPLFIPIKDSPDRLDEEGLDLLKRLLIKIPEDRITLKEVKRHPYVLRGIEDPAKWIDETDPGKRGGKVEITPDDLAKAVSRISGVFVQLGKKIRLGVVDTLIKTGWSRGSAKGRTTLLGGTPPPSSTSTASDSQRSSFLGGDGALSSEGLLTGSLTGARDPHVAQPMLVSLKHSSLRHSPASPPSSPPSTPPSSVAQPLLPSSLPQDVSTLSSRLSHLRKVPHHSLSASFSQFSIQQDNSRVIKRPDASSTPVRRVVDDDEIDTSDDSEGPDVTKDGLILNFGRRQNKQEGESNLDASDMDISSGSSGSEVTPKLREDKSEQQE